MKIIAFLLLFLSVSASHAANIITCNSSWTLSRGVPGCSDPAVTNVDWGYYSAVIIASQSDIAALQADVAALETGVSAVPPITSDLWLAHLGGLLGAYVIGLAFGGLQAWVRAIFHKMEGIS